MGAFGGRVALAAHQKRLTETVQAYLQYQLDKASGEETVDVLIPEAYKLLLRMRNLGQENEYWTGGWSAQPTLLYLEFESCIEAELLFKKLQKVNEALAAAHHKEQTDAN